MAKNKKLKAKIILLLKFVFIFTAIFIIVNNADTAKIAEHITNSNLLYLFFALITITLAHTVSGLRTRYYFSSQNTHLSKRFSVSLYFVGLLFNNALPSGIGGDGYKVYKISKLTRLRHLISIKLLISERANGLYLLLMLSFIIGYTINIDIIPYYKYLLILAAITTTICFFFGTKFIFKEEINFTLKAIKYSFIVQILNVATIYFIINSTAQIDYYTLASYILLFMASSVAVIIPVTIGGIGMRELIYLYGSSLLGLDPENGIAIALIFFTINFTSSLGGLLFWHKLDDIYKKSKLKKSD